VWFRSGTKVAGAQLRSAYTSALLFAVTRLAGLMVRLMPSRKAARIVQGAVRCLLKLTGQRVTVQGRELVSPDQSAVLVANRASRLDPLVLAAGLPSPYLIADSGAVAALPHNAAFLLKPLLLAPLKGEVSPPGGTLRQRIRRALEEGYSVLVFPDGPAGVPARLSRFRLDAIHAAVVTSSPIVPIGVRGTSLILEAARNSNGDLRESDARIHIGERIRPETTDQRELVRLRERIREAIARLAAR
jgi:1-acyl-sn-glycerol-3-phosphate acyltransferase